MINLVKLIFWLSFLSFCAICAKAVSTETYNGLKNGSSDMKFIEEKNFSSKIENNRLYVKKRNTLLESEDEEFVEELFIQPLVSGFVNTYFQFTTKWFYKDKKNLHNTRLIPRSIAEILLQYDIKELHISLTHGLWLYESWGYPVRDAPSGAEMWAWFAAENLTSEQVDDQWTRVANTLSGILCASLNFIDYTNTLSPKYGFRAQFVIPITRNDTKHVRYSNLPREIVCTENLTPWKKLLPCNSKNGFTSLLNSGHVYNTHYHSLAISMRTMCINENECMIEFSNKANLVFDSKLLPGSNNNEFSLRRLFGQGLNGFCALAKSSKIYVDLLASSNYELNPIPQYNISSIRGGYTSRYGVYDIQLLKSTRLFNIAWLQRKSNNVILVPSPPPLCTHRFIVGQGQERGELVTQITNNYHKRLPVIVQENIPWFMPIYLYTLKIRNLQTNELILPKVIDYHPGIQRKRPYHLEVIFEVPSKTTVEITIDFDYIFLKWLEYPPDANHGHYVGSAIIISQLPIARNYSFIPPQGIHFAASFNASQTSYILQLHTETLILSLPTPDFSMPYNVICLACTVVALAFGPIHSVATKRITIEKEIPPNALANTLRSISWKIQLYMKNLLKISANKKGLNARQQSDNDKNENTFEPSFEIYEITPNSIDK